MKNQEIRLQKYLAHQGIASRRAIEKMIKAGRIRVNNLIVNTMGMKIKPAEDSIAIDEQNFEPITHPLRYIILNKPYGYICSVHDERNRRTVLDLLFEVKERIYPVGRLDYNTAGLLLLTNDGELTYKLLHPSYEIEKTYLAEVKGILDKQDIYKLQHGIELQDGITAPTKIRILKKLKGATLVELKIHEGRNRQVRRMLDEVGHPVKYLKRTSFASLNLCALKEGEWRELNEAEINKLKKSIKKNGN